MLLTSARERPCNALTLRVFAVAFDRDACCRPRRLDLLGSVQLSLPFGPSTFTTPSPVMLTFTLSGISTTLFPIRDIIFNPYQT